jgi:hypothetical protein
MRVAFGEVAYVEFYFFISSILYREVEPADIAAGV